MSEDDSFHLAFHFFGLVAQLLTRDGSMEEMKEYATGWGETCSTDLRLRVSLECCDNPYRE